MKHFILNRLYLYKFHIPDSYWTDFQINSPHFQSFPEFAPISLSNEIIRSLKKPPSVFSYLGWSMTKYMVAFQTHRNVIFMLNYIGWCLNLKVFKKNLFFPIPCNATHPSPIARSLKLSTWTTVTPIAYGLAIFWTTNRDQGLAREGWQITKNSF